MSVLLHYDFDGLKIGRTRCYCLNIWADVEKVITYRWNSSEKDCF